MTLRILVLEGNDAEGRHRQKTRLGRTAAEGYSGCIRFIAPEAQIDICLAADEAGDVPDVARLRRYDGVVITGSALHIWEGKPEALRQVALARKVFEAGVPFFGSCWGLQVASAAAGGVVEKNPMGREVGVARAITIHEAGQGHPLLAGRPPVFSAPCIHLDAVTVPAPGTTILASNAMAPVQAAEIPHMNGVFWGVQYHPEFTLAYLAKLLRLNLDVHVQEGCFRDLQQGEEYCSDLVDLCHNPGQFQHVVWRYGIGPELTNRSIRMTEIRNFIEYRVRPHAQMRLAA